MHENLETLIYLTYLDYGRKRVDTLKCDVTSQGFGTHISEAFRTLFSVSDTFKNVLCLFFFLLEFCTKHDFL